MRKLLITMMLLGSMQLNAYTPLAKVKNGMRSLFSKELVEKVQHLIAIGIVGTGIAFTVPQVNAVADEHVTAVTAEDPIHRHSVMLLRSDDVEAGAAAGFHLVHVGSDEQGNAVLLGRELALDGVVANFLGEGYNLSLYGWDGLIADNLTVNLVEVFADKTDGIFNVVALAIEGLNLTDSYPAVAVDGNLFLHDAPVDLELVTFRPNAYGSLLSKAEIAADKFVSHWQACNLEPDLEAAKVAVGFTTCANPAGTIALGSLIFRDDIAVALHSRPSGRRDKQTSLASAFPQDAADFANAISGNDTNVTPVEARGKLATTWGALKKQR